MRLLTVISQNNKFGITQFEQFFEIRNTETRKRRSLFVVNNVASWLLDFFTETPQTYSKFLTGRKVTKHGSGSPNAAVSFSVWVSRDVVSG